jgi:hypothetical protein
MPVRKARQRFDNRECLEESVFSHTRTEFLDDCPSVEALFVSGNMKTPFIILSASPLSTRFPRLLGKL